MSRWCLVGERPAWLAGSLLSRVRAGLGGSLLSGVREVLGGQPAEQGPGGVGGQLLSGVRAVLGGSMCLPHPSLCPWWGSCSCSCLLGTQSLLIQQGPLEGLKPDYRSGGSQATYVNIPDRLQVGFVFVTPGHFASFTFQNSL